MYFQIDYIKFYVSLNMNLSNISFNSRISNVKVIRLVTRLINGSCPSHLFQFLLLFKLIHRGSILNSDLLILQWNLFCACQWLKALLLLRVVLHLILTLQRLNVFRYGLVTNKLIVFLLKYTNVVHRLLHSTQNMMRVIVRQNFGMWVIWSDVVF